MKNNIAANDHGWSAQVVDPLGFSTKSWMPARD